MNILYYVTYNIFTRNVSINFIDSHYEPLEMFIKLSDKQRLKEIINTIKENPDDEFHGSPGEYLRLRYTFGGVYAEVVLPDDSFEVWLPVEKFVEIAEEYFAVQEEMFKELGMI